MVGILALNSLDKYKGYAVRRRYLWTTVGVWATVLFLTWPVFRSGQRTALTGIGWLINHTIWGPPVEFVPLEDYADELRGVTIDEKGNLIW